MSEPTSTNPRIVRIGTRKSELALKQTYWVRDQLNATWGDKIKIEIVEISTRGDEILDKPLALVGGKGLFVSALEDRLLSEDVDLAVHSMKDLPADLPAGLVIACTPEREDPRDVVVTRDGGTLSGLSKGAKVGTSSLRRAALLKRLAGNIQIEPVRGNVGTRLKKLDDGEYDALVLAAAGLKRLGLEERITEYLPAERFCPACCQGILALEIREADSGLAELLAPLGHEATSIASRAERAFLSALEGNCQIPLGCYAELRAEDVLSVTGVVADPSGRPCFIVTKTGEPENAKGIGENLAQTLIKLGAGRIIENLVTTPKVA